MDFASSPISTEKNSVGPGMAGVPKKPDRCGVKHEIVALILTGIRASARKRRKAHGRLLPFRKEDCEGGYPAAGCFVQRARNRLRIVRIPFGAAQEGVEELEKKRDRHESWVSISKLDRVVVHPQQFFRKSAEAPAQKGVVQRSLSKERAGEQKRAMAGDKVRGIAGGLGAKRGDPPGGLGCVANTGLRKGRFRICGND